MAYGIHMSRDKVSTRIVRAEEKVVSLYITAGTGEFTTLTVNDDITVKDKVKALALTGITVTSRDVRAEMSLIVPTCITGAYRSPLLDGQMFVDEDSKLLYVVVAATLMLVTLQPM
jgi:hypothetical protein